MRVVEIIKDNEQFGKLGFFHGFFQYGCNSDGVEACAVIEFEDGTCNWFSASSIRFKSQPTTDGELCKK
jgi:hypothetical protein